MPRRLHLESLQAELAALSVLLAEAHSVNDAVGTMQFEQRKKELESEIQALQEAKLSEASVALYFSGAPVIGSRAIDAGFAGKALDQFQDIVSRQFAIAELGALGERGPVPHSDSARLMLTGVAQGSFGFLLDELSDKPRMFDTDLKEAVREAMSIIDAAGAVDDVVFEEAAERIDPRTLIVLKEFFVGLDSRAAAVRMVSDTRDLSLDESAVHRARVRTEATRIDEEDTEKSGVLVGFLPEHRRFELRLESGETIYGSATKESAEQYLSAIGRQCAVRVKERTVKPLNRPPRLVYRLLEFTWVGK